MGLLDRFKKAPGPDALTFEAVARARAVPGVAGAEAVDADTVEVRWLEHTGTSTLSLGEVREAWTSASGFDRIEIMDQVVAGLAPPSADATPPPPPPPEPEAETEPEPPGTEAPIHEPPAVEPRAAEAPAVATVVVDRPGRRDGAVRWIVTEGVEATVVLGEPAGPPVTEEDLAAAGTDADAVRAAALAHLRAADPALDPIGPGQPAWVPSSASAPAPAWLAVPDRLLAACGLDEAVALAPLPTELVVVDPSATELLASLLSSTLSIVSGDADVLVAAPLLVSATGVDAWLPPSDHPCAALVGELRSST